MKNEGMFDLDNPNPDGSLNLTPTGQEIIDASHNYLNFCKSIGDMEAYRIQKDILDINLSIGKG